MPLIDCSDIAISLEHSSLVQLPRLLRYVDPRLCVIKLLTALPFDVRKNSKDIFEIEILIVDSTRSPELK